MGNRRGDKVIRISPSKDDKGLFYFACAKKRHLGIIPEDIAKQCANGRPCEHLVIYRPENYREKRKHSNQQRN